MHSQFAGAKELIAELDALVEVNKDYEFPQTVYSGSQNMLVLGNIQIEDGWKFVPLSSDRETFDAYPLAEVWREFFKTHPVAVELLLTAWTLIRAGVDSSRNKLPATELDIFFGSDFTQNIPTVQFPAQVGKILELQLLESAPPERIVQIISAIRSHTPWYFSWMLGAWHIPAVNCFVELLANLPPLTEEAMRLCTARIGGLVPKMPAPDWETLQSEARYRQARTLVERIVKQD